MAAADRIIFATPIYMLTITSLLKTLLDRMYSTMDISDARLSNGLIHHHIDPAISSKPFLPLILCSNLENESWKNAAAYFRTYTRFMETRQAGLLIRNASPLFDVTHNLDLARQYPKVDVVLQAYRQSGSELATLRHIRWQTQRRANQEVIPVPFFWLLKRFKPIKQRVIQTLNDPHFRTDRTNTP
jgi:NAD(P)H-dependent FMN reductase